MKSLLTAAALSVLTAFATATSALAKPPEDVETRPKFSIKNDATIDAYAIEVSSLDGVDDNGDDFDILIAALQSTGVIAAFDGTADYTVFAPNDDAFIALAEELAGPGLDEASAAGALLALGNDYITSVLQYHVAEGVRNSRSVTRAKAVKTLLEGETLSVDGGVVFAAETDAALLNIDNRFSDGMIHVIDFVLIPFFPEADE